MPDSTDLAELGARAVLVGVTGSASDLLTVPEAARAAVRERVRLLVVHIISTVARDGHGEIDDSLLARFAESGEAVLARAVEIARENAPSLAIDQALLHGERVEVLRQVSTRAHRTYIGTSETSSVRPMVPGQVTVETTRRPPGPLFMVRGPKSEQGSRVLAYLDQADERGVVALAEHEARALGLPLTIVYHGAIGTAHPVGEDVPVTRVLVPQKQRAQRMLASPRNELLVISAGDLEAERAIAGPADLRRRYAGAAGLVAVVPDAVSPST